MSRWLFDVNEKQMPQARVYSLAAMFVRAAVDAARLQSLVHRVAYSQAVATLGTATSQDLAAVGCLHAMMKTMLVGFLAIRGLERSFHLNYNCFCSFLIFAPAKLHTFFKLHKLLSDFA